MKERGKKKRQMGSQDHSGPSLPSETLLHPHTVWAQSHPWSPGSMLPKRRHADPSQSGSGKWKTQSPGHVCYLWCFRMLGWQLWKQLHLLGSPQPARSWQNRGVCVPRMQGCSGGCRCGQTLASGCSLNSDEDWDSTRALLPRKWSTLRTSGSATGSLNSDPSPNPPPVVTSTPISCISPHTRPTPSPGLPGPPQK